MLNAAKEAGPSRYQGELQGCQGSTHDVQPAADPTQLPGSNR